MNTWQWYLFLIFLFLCVQAFFAMMEMSIVSFNKVRLQYYVSRKKPAALLLNSLLNKPTTLFGTTLICVNAALQFGSECARRFYAELGLNPDWAPLTQVVLVIIFAELSPLFAARRHAEQVALSGVSILNLFSKILSPVIWLIDLLCRAIYRLFHIRSQGGLYLTREEIQKAVEAKEISKYPLKEEGDFDSMASRMFNLKTKNAVELMQPIGKVPIAPSVITVKEMREILQKKYTPYLPLFHRTEDNIVAIAYPRDLLRIQDHKRVREHAVAPWFVTENTPLLQILKQFRRNNQSLAIVLNKVGGAVGILTLDAIIDELFELSDSWNAFSEITPRMHPVVIDRTFPGEMKILEFNQKFQVHLDSHGMGTLAELMSHLLGHHPSVGESIRVDQFELTVEEAALFEAKKIAIRTIY